MTRKEIITVIEEKKLVAVVRVDDPDDLINVSEALLKGGVSIIELTMTIPGALGKISELREKLGDSILVGMGSVLDAQTARNAMDAGSQFIVSPVMRPEIIDAAHENDVPVSVGAYTPTEILEASDRGADVVKIFPANQLGPSYIKAVRAPMPHLKLLPTGGVSSDNIHLWLEAGTFALGVGSALVDMKAIREKNFDLLTEKARVLTEKVNSYKANAK
ncbi:MAG: bifunctional 4-hydroxy-2-oxoglutarate aldolase/2-dehydro-3-deoxy-phosphogluconate aldolase [Balneolaceae bacterium]